MLDVLRRLGKTELLAILLALEKGAVHVDDVVSGLGVSRSRAYTVLSRLASLGLLERVERGWYAPGEELLSTLCGTGKSRRGARAHG